VCELRVRGTSLFSFLLGIAVTIGAAYVHDAAAATPTDKRIVNWDQLGDVTRDALEVARSQWNRLTSR
jgi:hypothetical protein